MKIEFVNHASFVVEHNDVRIICDPWLEGTVFNNGWGLISKTKFSYEDFDKIDYQVFELDGLDVRYRYPLPNLDPEDDEVEIAITQAEVIFEFVKERCV